ncbi:MAG TPA: hypothetical protein VNL35_15365 [Chloroflexota bacterium]|nr:hypothetical protein [Chloroflexota bacterium]
MNDSHVYAVPPADRASLPALDSRKHARRRIWQRRLILALPRLSLVLVVAVLALGASLQFSSSRGAQDSAPIYTVDQVQAGLRANPSAWTGQEIRVYGVLQGPFVFCAKVTPCPAATLGLVDDGNGILGSGNYLPVVIGSMDSAALPYNVPATFTLKVKAAPDACARNAAILCYQAALQDTGSVFSGE